ncbi:uncharacterized protein B0P05DRAFT_534859 [Gilbertella persicaria]|uniref:uncharacterized protein n=1 Tax=Gilbertella persicaria TaxID=101096 RepID=UPI00221E41E0|nr:uncharacterized protein B0P05DRAFT_534859 [Gilbertella persicaria]KAI8084260.1 hypothetical protein B0P05DRAFT_534859 [Gilbertella persicaria]
MTYSCLTTHTLLEIINPFAYDAQGEANLDILEYQNPHTANDVFYALNSYGAKGRQAYLSYLFNDVLFVTARTVPVIVICSWAYQKAPESIRPGIWLPLLNWAADLLESGLLYTLIKMFPQRIEWLEWLTAYVIRFKWITFQGTIGLLFVSMLVGVYYAFHTLLADSVMMEKDRQKKVQARDSIQQVLQGAAARREASSNKKNA